MSTARTNNLQTLDNSVTVAVADLPKAINALPFLASQEEGKGDALVSVLQPLAGSTPRTQHLKNLETISVMDFGAKGDGVTDDSPAFSAAAKADDSLIHPKLRGV